MILPYTRVMLPKGVRGTQLSWYVWWCSLHQLAAERSQCEGVLGHRRCGWRRQNAIGQIKEGL